MHAAQTEERVKRVVIDQLGIKLEEAKLDARLIEDLNMDSLDAVEMTMALEEEFEIEISDEDAASLFTIGDIIDYIIKKVK